MQSASLCFSKPLFKKQSRRFWPLWSLYTLGLLMALPGVIAMQRSVGAMDLIEQRADIHNYLSTFASMVSPWVSAVYAIFIAMAIWSYLYNHRAVSMMHALPLSRGGMFFTNFGTGLLFGLVPNLLIAILTALSCLLVGGVPVKALLLWFVIQSLTYFFFFSFATLVAFITGQIVALPALYLIFNGLAGLLYVLIQMLCAGFVYGYAQGSVLFYRDLSMWLTPLWGFVQGLSVQSVEGVNSQYFVNQIVGLDTVVVYALVGLVMAVCAYLLYRRRQLELSGEVVAVGFLRPVFRYGVGIVSGLALGMLTTAFFHEVGSDRYGATPSIGMLLAFSVLWTLIGYFAAEMLLQKSFRVFKRATAGAVVLALLFAAALLAMEFDLGGYERKLPEADQVIALTGLSERGRNEDQEVIAAALALHASIIENKTALEALRDGGGEALRMNGITAKEYAKLDWQYFELQYEMQDGSYFTRSYQIPLSQALLQDAESPASRYQTLVNNPAWIMSSYFPPQVENEALSLIEVQKLRSVTEQDRSLGGDSDPSDGGFISFSGADAQLLLAAIREDIAAGRLGQTTLFWQGENENYENMVYISFRGAYNDAENTYAYGNWVREPQLDALGNRTGKRLTAGYDLNITLQKTASATLAVLAQHGLIPGENILTSSERNGKESAEKEMGYGDPFLAEETMTNEIYQN